ncbi:ATP-dependent Clp protease proteolytic subunit [Ancylobacter vacuolatus]|uniref:ATP-dependent protease ClpP protease subunit n=1 Tax=Ancylobacter vacuolatus TaxID=223389 RepID=A0ABU0DLU1_9HYPH|nr:ATP-dependent Clp protease proteolytic subunit [Ancylobacter vacuolatus]MDQ0349401.1 ATP-dependent protease ClpP protease subunit [Ancylobacter vacuolatus]
MVSRTPKLDRAKRLLRAAAKPAPKVKPSTTNAAFVALRIEGDVDDAMANRVERQLAANPNASTIFMHVNSRGGLLIAGRRIFDAIRKHPAGRKIAHGRGTVASAAALIYAAADVRRLEPGTQVLLHRAEAGSPVASQRLTAGRCEAIAKSLASVDAEIAEVLASRCDAPLAVIRAEMRTEKAMPLAKAVSIGFAHEVVGETPPLSASWPAQARAVMSAVKRFTVGAAASRFSNGYLHACRVAGR